MPGGRTKANEAERRAEVARYLQHIVDQAGYESQAELAGELRIPASSLSHWLSETSERGLDAYSMLRVMRAVERRKAGASAVPIDRPLENRLRSLEKQVRELPTADDLQRGLDTLRVAIDALANPGTQTASGS